MQEKTDLCPMSLGTRCTQLMQQVGVKLDQGKTHPGEKDNAALEYGP